MEILKVENLTKTYGSGENLVHAVDDVSFSVEKGEFVAIVGASGSGKSTLLHLVNVTVGKNLFFVSAHLPGAMDHRAGSGNQFAKRMCIFQRTAHPSKIIIDVSAGSTRQCANVKSAGEQEISFRTF